MSRWLFATVYLCTTLTLNACSTLGTPEKSASDTQISNHAGWHTGNTGWFVVSKRLFVLRNVGTGKCLVGGSHGGIVMRECTNDIWNWERRSRSDLSILVNRNNNDSHELCASSAQGFIGEALSLTRCYDDGEEIAKHQQIEFHLQKGSGFQLKLPFHERCLSATSDVTLQACNRSDHNQLWVPRAVDLSSSSPLK